MEKLHYFGAMAARLVLEDITNNCKNPIVKFWIKPIFNGVLAIGYLSCALFLASSAFGVDPIKYLGEVGVEKSGLLIDPIKNLGEVGADWTASVLLDQRGF